MRLTLACVPSLLVSVLLFNGPPPMLPHFIYTRTATRHFISSNATCTFRRDFPQTQHLHLPGAISAPLRVRAQRGARTHLRKVKAHAGCVGNELADIGATFAACQGCIHEHFVSSLPAWHVVLPVDGGVSPEPYTPSLPPGPRGWSPTAHKNHTGTYCSFFSCLPGH